jgi:hypothetical protein
LRRNGGGYRVRRDGQHADGDRSNARCRYDVLPALASGGSAAKAFLADIYQRYVGSSAGTAKGISLNSVKTVRSYFTFGLASLIIEPNVHQQRQPLIARLVVC